MRWDAGVGGSVQVRAAAPPGNHETDDFAGLTTPGRTGRLRPILHTGTRAARRATDASPGVRRRRPCQPRDTGPHGILPPDGHVSARTREKPRPWNPTRP